jgi:hypothetical protein
MKDNLRKAQTGVLTGLLPDQAQVYMDVSLSDVLKLNIIPNSFEVALDK